jgi:hypothetical protein
VILSVGAVALAPIANVATPGPPPTARALTRVAADPSPSVTPEPSMPATEPEPTKPAIDKGKVYVEVYNNSGVTGLAGEVAASATQAGWKVGGSDNWYGTIPASSVYYPPKLARAARALALDLGIRRTVPAVDPMKLDRLTVILTADHA